MFDFLRDLRKSEEEKRQEALSAYLDGALTPREEARFERLLASDEHLRASLEEQRLLSATMRRLPRVPAPRNFTLDPALYGRPVSSTSMTLYPIMRAATAVVAILFVLVLVLDFAPFDLAGGETEQTVAEATESMAQDREVAPAEAQAPLQFEVEEAPVAGSAIEVTRVVEEVEMEEAAEEAAAEEAAAEKPAAEEPEAAMAAPEAEMPAEAIVAEEMEPPAAAGDAAGGDAPAGEGRLATPAADVAAQPLATVDGRPLVDALRATATAAGEMAASDETSLDQPDQPAPSRTAQAVTGATDDETAVAEAEAGDTSVSDAGAGLSTLQLLAIILGLGLVALALATLALRRSHQ